MTTRNREKGSLVALRSPRRSRRAQVLRDLDIVAMFEEANDIVVVNDREGNVVIANRVAREFGGYTLDEMENGVNLHDVMPAEDFEAAMLFTQSALDGLPVPEVYEREALQRDGTRRVLELRSNVLELKNGQRLLQTIGRDVTDSRRAAAFQASLVQVAQALLTAQRVGDVGTLICEEALRVLEVDGVYLWLRHAEGLIGSAGVGIGASGFLGTQRAIDDSFIGNMFSCNELTVINDVESHHDLLAAHKLGIAALLGIPLRRPRETVGILVFAQRKNANYFTRPMCDRALIFAAQAAVAIESAISREREEEEGRVSAALLQVSQAIRSSLEESDVLMRIARVTREVLHCDWVLTGVWDPKGYLRIVGGDGWSRDLLDEIRLIEFRPEMFAVLDPLFSKQPIEVPAPHRNRPLFERWDTSSLRAVPMLRNDNLVGIVAIGFRKRLGAFSDREHKVLDGVALKTAVAIENARLVQDLRHANQLKSEFLGAMSHELRTPVSVLLGYAELLRDGVMGSLSAEQSDALDRMLINARGLLELINTTLDVNRLEAGKVNVDHGSFSVAGLIDELKVEYGARIASASVGLEWRAPDGALTLYTDRNKLKVVLRNLIDNALKYTPAGRISVRADLLASGERLSLSVSDTGIGIPSEAQQSIFEMFRQISPSAGRSGVGLGLYLVRRYVQLLGGEVKVESTPDVGSTFTVLLPVGEPRVEA